MNVYAPGVMAHQRSQGTPERPRGERMVTRIGRPVDSEATILVADDSPEQLSLIRRIVEAEGYRCVPAPDGQSVVELCTSDRIDVALIDVNMPEPDGLMICRQMKQSPDTALIPVLLMTGMTDGATHLRALEAGADDFVPKPFHLAELRARLRSAVRMKHCTDELDNVAASILMLGATIEARDPYTHGHCDRIAVYSTLLGRRIGLGTDDLQALERGGYLHDLGKVAIPDRILFKPGPLTTAEFQLIRSHTTVGDRICAPLRTLSRERTIIRSHHELLDGTGYPDGLRGADIPLVAQVTAIADVFDSLTTDRPYHAAVSQSAALDMLRDDVRAGKRDAALVAEFAAAMGA